MQREILNHAKKVVKRGLIIPLFILLSFSFFSNPLYSQQVGISKAVNSTTPLTGEEIAYQIDFGCSSLTSDCIGAKIIDTLPPIFEFVAAEPIIIQTSGGPVAYSPTYDAVSHTLTYDFTTLPEMGLPDGFSGAAFFTMRIPAGATPNGISVENKVDIISDNAGDDMDSVTVVTQATPQWSLSKSADQMIYHDRDITYTIQLCSDAQIGNLNLSNIVVTDTLPAGADFVSATNGGVWDGNDPGIVMWTFPFRDVMNPCLSMDVVVNYPSADMVNNATGLATSIPKLNKVVATADPVGESTINLFDSVDDALLPPNFTLGIQKEANDDDIIPLGRINYFDIGIANPSTTAVDSFRVYDAIPSQFDLSYIRFTDFPIIPVPVIINVEVNNSGTLIPWDTTTTAQELLDTASLPYDPTVDYISAVEFLFGSVASGFGGTIRMVVTPVHDGPIGSAVDNMGNAVALNTSYENCAELSATRPIDGMKIMTMPSCDAMCFQDTVARLDPNKLVVSSNEMPPPGDMTTGNPYLPGSRVTYTLHLENDGSDDLETDNNGAISNDTIHNPIGADLLPAGLDYIPDSWRLINNTTDLTLDTLGGNPTFELVPNFNGTGQTLLRWQFAGDFLVNQGLDITFIAKIDTASGTVLTNNFCMSAGQDFYCDEATCGSTETTDINNYFGTIANPSMLINGIDEMCCQTTSFTVADSVAVLMGDKNILSTGPYAPTGTDVVALGLATDTIQYLVNLTNSQAANTALPNPISMDFLPEQLEYVTGSIVLVDNTTGLTLDGINPVFEVLHDYVGTGRTLLKWTFDGAFPINSGVSYSFKTLIKAGAGGIVTNDYLYKSDDRFYNCLSGLEALDEFDLDADGNVLELFCRSSSPPSLIQTNASLSAKKLVKGALDTTYLELPDIGLTQPNDSIFWRINVLNPGNVPLTEIVIVDVFPYIGDVGVQLNTTDRETGWRPFLVDSIIYPTDLNVTVYYSNEENPCRPEIEPISTSGCVDDWTTTTPSDLSTVQAFKIMLNDTLYPGENFPIDIKMLAPDSASIINPVAWNSIARNAKEIPAQEPNKVGVKLIYHDLALTKTLKSGFANPFEVNDTVTFEINVFNQANNKVHDVELVEYLPNGLTLADNNWTSVDDSTATFIYTDTILGGASTTVEVKLVIDRDVAGETLFNYAEITAAKDSLFNTIADFDSTPDDDRGNDPNDIDNNTTGDTPTDEDDHDGEQLVVEACAITGLNFSTQCIDNGTPDNPLDDEFILFLEPTGTSLSGSYSVTMGFMAMDSIPYGAVYSSAGDSTFMAVMGGVRITIQDDSDPACVFTDSIPSPAPCSKIDLALEKSVDTTCAEPGDTVTFRIVVKKEMWDITIEDVDVRDTLPDGFTYLSYTRIPNQGWYNAGTGRWRIGTIPEGVDSVVLLIDARVDDFQPGGIITNKAQVSHTDLDDIDSDANNNLAGEDDIDFACVSIPLYVCPDLQDSVLLTTPLGSTNVQWFRDTGTTVPFLVGTDTTFYAKAKGTYTFISDVNLCDGGKCCPYYVREGCFDLALRKTLADSQIDSVAPGENVIFTIKVFNQGDFPAYEVDIIDYLPEYLTLNDNDWTSVNDSTARYTFSGNIPVGDSVAVDLTATVDLNYQDSLLINFAEIEGATDEPGGMTKPDRDSAPDDNSTNDTGGIYESITDNEIDNTPPIDEDDHDPAGIQVYQIFDLALKKTLTATQNDTVTWLDTVDFEITIYNQGTLHAYDIEIADYVPDSMNFIVNLDWALTDDTAFYIIDTLLARDSVKIPISLAVNNLFRGDSLVNFAEIAYASETSGSGIPSLDEDSTSDTNNTNDGGGAVDSPSDDYVNGIGGGVPNSGTAVTDEDDHDPVLVHIVPCSLEVTIFEEICQGDDFDFNGTLISVAGQYIDTLTANQFDCDSIITLNLGVNDTFQTVLNIDLCMGDTYNFNGQDMDRAGTYRDTLLSNSGCDSFIVANIFLRPIFKVLQHDTICSMTPYPFDGSNLTVSGTYFDTLASQYGCDSIIQLNLVVRDCDWGDLPDVTAGTGPNDYQTTAANNGPVHIIIPGLSLGTTIDAESDGQPDATAMGDDLDEDGLTIFPTLDISPGITIKIPLETTNTTGTTAHLEVWIDWNGDGILDDVTEKVIDTDDSGGLPTYLTINVPSTAVSGQEIGVRVRYSHTDNMTPYGEIESGEVEDYLLSIDCPQVCFPASFDFKRK